MQTAKQLNAKGSHLLKIINKCATIKEAEFFVSKDLKPTGDTDNNKQKHMMHTHIDTYSANVHKTCTAQNSMQTQIYARGQILILQHNFLYSTIPAYIGQHSPGWNAPCYVLKSVGRTEDPNTSGKV